MSFINWNKRFSGVKNVAIKATKIDLPPDRIQSPLDETGDNHEGDSNRKQVQNIRRQYQEP